jgi:ribose/xylose/arabinose/galactoside ABC-type transport system permease subunit
MSVIEFQSPPPTAAIRATNALDWRELLKRLGPLVGLLFVFAVFSALRFSSFLTVFNIRIMLLQTAVVGTAALGMTMIIISGGIDLSVGSNVAFCSVVIALLLNAHVPPVIAALGGVATGLAVGLLMGGLITGLRISPFIITLGLMGALRGAAKGLADNGVIYPPTDLRNSWLATLLRLEAAHPWLDLPQFAWVGVFASLLLAIALTWVLFPGLVGIIIAGAVLVTAVLTWGLIPPGVWLMVVLAFLIAGMLQYSKFGRHIFAIGSNEQTARLCGINVARTKVQIYVVATGLVGIASMLHFSFLYEGDPTSAFGMELDVIAAVVIGGASLSGGEGTILGSLAGALMMTAVANGCEKMNYPNWVQEIVTGIIIVIAAGLDRLRHRRTS